ncbi:hypothetical protein SLE2022_206980 [Rubroshorea leprosula]
MIVYHLESFNLSGACLLIKDRVFKYYTASKLLLDKRHSLNQKLIKWEKPPYGYFKLNTDGSMWVTQVGLPVAVLLEITQEVDCWVCKIDWYYLGGRGQVLGPAWRIYKNTCPKS